MSAFAHRRLAIHDLSWPVHQSIVSTSGHFVILFNDEIYNHQDVRRNLEDSRRGSAPHPVGQGRRKWRGHSGMETLLAAVEVWGPDAALARTVGMFAMTIRDRKPTVLALARDRVGRKRSTTRAWTARFPSRRNAKRFERTRRFRSWRARLVAAPWVRALSILGPSRCSEAATGYPLHSCRRLSAPPHCS